VKLFARRTPLPRHLEHLFACLLQLVLEVDIRGRDEGMDPRVCRIGQRLHDRSISCGVVRQSAAITGRRQTRATSRTAAKSSSEATGNPASSTSTPRASSCLAIRSFSSRFILQPGDCSPSRRVVSNMATRSLMLLLLLTCSLIQHLLSALP
jgi:hypothetical protein